MGRALTRRERVALCDLLAKVGPQAPTLCEGWATGDLAAHLYVRERKPLAATGIVLGGPFKASLAKATSSALALGYEHLIEALRSGPPAWLRPFDAQVNALEYFVHHEDVRRANVESMPRPEAEISELEDLIWSMLSRRTSWFLVRKLKGAGLELAPPNRAAVTIKAGRPVARLEGRPGELALYLTGRGAVAQVRPSGDPDAIAALTTTSWGL